MQVTAAVARSRGEPFSIEELELDEPRDDEVVVRIVAAGVCHTDLFIRDGHYPTPFPSVLGHEGAGVVEAVGRSVRKVRPGDHVALSFGSCGQCGSCQRGRPGYCLDFWGSNFGCARQDGSTTLARGGEPVHGRFFSQSSFATHALATVRNVVKVPEDAPLELLGPLGCGIQTGAGTVLNALKPPPGSTLVVFGCGSVGLSSVMAAPLTGATTIVAVDVNDDRLALAGELGATHTVNPRDGDPVEQVREATGGGGAAFAVEATGLPEVLRQAVDCLSAGGTAAVVGAAPIGAEVALDMSTILALGRTVRGVVEGDSVPDVFIPALIELYRQGRFPFDRLVTFYDFEELNRAADDSEAGRVVKPIVRMPGA